jgi:hypothetical protein
MDILPNDIEKIILNYKTDMEVFEKFQNILIDINFMLIEYHIPMVFPECNYILKIMKYSNKKKINVICKCCGENILDTFNHFDNFHRLDSQDIMHFLLHIEYSLKLDYYNGRTLRCLIDNYSTEKYNQLCNIIYSKYNI